MAILGNRDPHVHAHVFPRRPSETNSGRAPWDQAAALTKLSADVREHLRLEIAQALLD